MQENPPTSDLSKIVGSTSEILKTISDCIKSLGFSYTDEFFDIENPLTDSEQDKILRLDNISGEVFEANEDKVEK